MADSKIVTGARVVVYVNGNLFGRVDSFRWAYNTPKKEIRGIDVPYALEFAPTTQEIVATISIYKLAADGGAQGAGMSAEFVSISQEKYFTIQLVERVTDTTIFRSDFCSVQNENWEVSARGLLKGTVTFKGINIGNEVSTGTVPL